jgi:hypothetical protein
MDWNIYLRYTRNINIRYILNAGGRVGMGYSFHLNHPPFLNRQRKNGENFPAFANRFFVWNRGRAIRDGGMRNAMFL